MEITKEMVEKWLGREVQDYKVTSELQGSVLKYHIKVQVKQPCYEIKIIVTPTKTQDFINTQEI